MSLRVQCLVWGNDPDNFFYVDIPANNPFPFSVQKAIKEAYPQRFAYVDTESLELRMVNFRLDDLHSKLKDLTLDKYPTLHPRANLSAIPDNGLGFLPIIVIPPRILRLYCAVESKEVALKSIFFVDIDDQREVGDLQRAIMRIKKSQFNHLEANQLTLYKVSVPLDDTGDKLKVDLPSDALHPYTKLSKLFCDLRESRLRIIIRVPKSGELLESFNCWIDDLTNVVLEVKEGRRSISNLKKRYKNVLSSILKAMPPADSSKSAAYTKSQIAYSICDGRYKENEARTNVAPPVQLFHPAFAQFLDDLKSTDTIPDDVVRTTIRYMKASSAIYASEDNRRAALNPILNKILCVNIQMVVNDDKTTPSGVVELLLAAGPIFILLKEDKNEFGEGGSDPSTQAGLSTGRSWAQEKFEPLRDATNCPTFVLATAGPWIVILGAVFTDGLIIQRLTDYIWVGLDSALNEDHITRTARFFNALKNGLENLKSYYEAVRLSSGRSEPAPSRYFPSIRAYPGLEGPVRFKYIGFLEDTLDCTTLHAQTLATPPKDIVVKFVTRYGERAHRLLANEKLAPELLYCGSPRLDTNGPTYASLYMVVMEFVDGHTLAELKLKKEEKEQVRKRLQEALDLLHSNGLVFGDLRSPNIMVTTSTMDIKIIDFDWAGDEGQVKYPPLLSLGLGWPAGVEPLAVIKKEHDDHMLKNIV